jgi:outer membrane lipoprotein SlyB
MTTINKTGAVLAVVGVLTLGGCQTLNNTSSSDTPNTGSVYSGYGVVQSIELVQQERNSGIAGSGIGIGTLAGAAAGGLIGNQVGGGTGKTIATVAGVAGGAYAGNMYDNRQQQTADAYRITVRMENGSYQTLTQNTNAGFRVGDRVRINNGSLQRY